MQRPRAGGWPHRVPATTRNRATRGADHSRHLHHVIPAQTCNSTFRRWIAWPVALLIGAGAAVALAGNLPLQYLDEETGATVTVVGRPLVFIDERSRSRASDANDFVTLAAAAVNQSGKISYVLIVYFWSTGAPRHPEGASPGAEPIVLQVDDRSIKLVPHGRSAREAGIGAPVHQPPFGDGTRYLYAIDLATVRFISESRQLALHVESKGPPLNYELFEDRRVAMKQFALLMGAND
jgi:hypothetical protein